MEWFGPSPRLPLRLLHGPAVPDRSLLKLSAERSDIPLDSERLAFLSSAAETGSERAAGVEEGFPTVLAVVSRPGGADPAPILHGRLPEPTLAGLGSWKGSKLLGGQGFLIVSTLD